MILDSSPKILIYNLLGFIKILINRNRLEKGVLNILQETNGIYHKKYDFQKKINKIFFIIYGIFGIF